jgi:hypothetical protein
MNMRSVRLLVLLIVIGFSHNIYAVEIFVAPDGQPTGSGTIDDPLDITTAFTKGSSPAQAGDTILLRGGTYTPNPLNLDISGTQSLRITIMPHDHETVVIDGINGDNATQTCIIEINGDYLTLRDIIVTSSYDERWSDSPESSPPDINNKAGIYSYGHGSHIINCIIYNNVGNGLGHWTGENSIVYGNIVFNNGWNGPDRGHGHGIYFRSNLENKLVKDNIFFNSYANGIDGYMGNGNVNTCQFIGNISFNAGACSWLDSYTSCIFAGGGSPLFDVSANENIAYQDFESPYKRQKSTVHFGMSAVNQDVEFHDNYVMGASVGLSLNRVDYASFMNNHIISDPYSVLSTLTDNGTSSWEGDYNKYSSLNENGYFVDGDWSEWRPQGLDTNSVFHAAYPTTNEVIIRPNEYEDKRAHIAIMNWEEQESVTVDLSGILEEGDDFYIYDVENMVAPVVQDTFYGRHVAIPLNLTENMRPDGEELVEVLHTETKFGVYLLSSRPIPLHLNAK